MPAYVQELLTIAIRAVALIVTLIATRYVIPWLKEQSIYATIKKLVQAAEKLANTGVITKAGKKQWVRDLLEHLGIKVTEQVDALIESAVEELDWMTGEIFPEFDSAEIDAAAVTKSGENDDSPAKA